VLGKVLAFAFVGLVLGKLFFRRQLRAFGKWLDGIVNAFIVAIAIAYSIQLVIYLVTRR